MDDEERKMLFEIHEAFFVVPLGSSADTKTLIADIRLAVKAHQRLLWITRVIVWTLPTLAGLGVAIKTLISLLKGGGA